ncbi:hypothetical protein FS837_002321 [Tulasnella sp. UAMH 9824]|nr:hypothetical protein FS837_002321 [Tulasnella sp. UAMH 9824]
MALLDFSEDDLLDSLSTASTRTDPTPAVISSPVISPIDSSLAPVQSMRSSRFYYSDLLEVHVCSGSRATHFVPKALLQNSSPSHSSSITTANTEIHGCPLILERVSSTQMEAFLDVADTRIIAPKKDFSFEQLAGALFVANHLNLSDLRTFINPAIEEGLNRLDPFQCIEAAELYKVEDWLLRPFCRICERYDSLSPSEMGRLGLERSSAVARVREKLIRTGHSAEVLDLFSSSDRSRYDSDTIRHKTLRLIEEEPLLFQLLPNGSPTLRTQPLDTSTAFPARFAVGDFISMKVQSYLYSLPIAYFQSPELLRVLQKQGNGALVMLPFDFSQSDWEIFLRVVTARPYANPPLRLSFREWVRGLRVAKLMEHNDASNYIRTEIQTKFLEEDTVDLLAAAIKLEFPESKWLQDRFNALADRRQNISAEEILRLGARATETLCRLREQRAYNRGKASVSKANAPEANAPEVSASEAFAPEPSSPEAFAPEAFAPEPSSPEGFAPEPSLPEGSAPGPSTPQGFAPKARSFAPKAMIGKVGAKNKRGKRR